MQHIEDNGFILSASKFSEHDAIVSIFTREHGMVRGVFKGAQSKKNRALLEPGNLVQLAGSARLEEHLYKLTLESIISYPALVLSQRAKLAALSSICSLLHACLAERDPHPELFHPTHLFFELLSQENTLDSWMLAYIQLELLLLEATGFGLDLSQCAATGQANDLRYVSPKSGRAVSAHAGAPYHEKLLPLSPTLLAAPHASSPQHLRDGLRVTGHFLHHWLFESLGRNMPEIREQLPRFIAAA